MRLTNLKVMVGDPMGYEIGPDCIPFNYNTGTLF